MADYRRPIRELNKRNNIARAAPPDWHSSVLGSMLRAATRVSNSYANDKEKGIAAYLDLSPKAKTQYVTIHDILLRSNLDETRKKYIQKTGIIDYNIIKQIRDQQRDMSIPPADRIISSAADSASFPVDLLSEIYESDLIANKPDMDGPALSEPAPIYNAVRGAYGAVTDRLGFRMTNPNHLENFFEKQNTASNGGSRKKKRTVKRKRTRTQRRR